MNHEETWEQGGRRPLWVALAFSSIESRRGALSLIWASALFTLYCVPWSHFFSGWVGRVFLIDDWTWAALMLPVLGWYLLSLRWMDSHRGWSVGGVGET